MSQKNNVVYNKNGGFVPPVKKKKKNTPSFYLVLILLIFTFFGALLGAYAFVENRVNADELIPQENFSFTEYPNLTTEDSIFVFNNNNYNGVRITTDLNSLSFKFNGTSTANTYVGEFLRINNSYNVTYSAYLYSSVPNTSLKYYTNQPITFPFDRTFSAHEFVTFKPASDYFVLGFNFPANYTFNNEVCTFFLWQGDWQLDSSIRNSLAFQIGKFNGYLEGESAGYDRGYNLGFEVGENQGQTSGFDSGYDSGYSAGYNAGISNVPEESANGGIFLQADFKIFSESSNVDNFVPRTYKNANFLLMPSSYYSYYNGGFIWNYENGFLSDISNLSNKHIIIDIDFGLGVEVNSFLSMMSYYQVQYAPYHPNYNNGEIFSFVGLTPNCNYYFIFSDNSEISYSYGVWSDFVITSYAPYNWIDLSSKVNLKLKHIYMDTRPNYDIFPDSGVVYLNPFSYFIPDYSNQRSFSLGYNQGLLDNQENVRLLGYHVGYSEGKADGLASANDYSFLGLMGAVVDAPVKVLSGLLNFDLLGFNLWNFFTAILTLALVVFVIKLFL